MGNSAGYVREIPFAERKPRSARSRFAPVVARALIKWTQENVIRSHDHHPNEERECYEVALELREEFTSLKDAVEDIVPGSARSRPGAPKNTITLSDKIALVFSDRVSHEIIRPGPKPEDRQAGDLSAELDVLLPEIEALIAQVIAVEDGIEGFAAAAKS